MEISNIILGNSVVVDATTSLNNVKIGDGVKIAKYCSIFGSKMDCLEIGKGSYIGMFSILNGYSAKLTIGSNVSIAQNVNIMTDSGPNASLAMQSIYPIFKGEVTIGSDCWIGAGTIIMPDVSIGSFCIIAANSFVNSTFEQFSIIGGSPARLIRKLQPDEIKRIRSASDWTEA